MTTDAMTKPEHRQTERAAVAATRHCADPGDRIVGRDYRSDGSYVEATADGGLYDSELDVWF